MKGTVYVRTSGGITSTDRLGNFSTLAGCIRHARREITALNECDIIEEHIGTHEHTIRYRSKYIPAILTSVIYAVQTDSIVPGRINPRVWR